AAKLHPIVCVGETARDEEGSHFTHLARNITQSLSRVDASAASRLTIAYDPVWAIGKSEPPPSRVVSEGVMFIRKTLAGMWGREAALKTRIIYGGSVDAASAAALAAESGVQGFIPGRASVSPEEFAGIVRAFL